MKRSSIFAMMLSLVLVLSACGGSGNGGASNPSNAENSSETATPTNAEGPSADLQDVSIMFDYVLYGHETPFFAGKQLGYYSDEGMNLDLKESKGSREAIQAVINGQADFALADGAISMQYIAQNAPLKVVALFFEKNPSAIVFNGDKIKSVENLKGKTVGMSSSGAAEALLPAFLSANNLKDGDVKEINIDGSARLNSLISGKIDATTFPAYASLPALEEKGFPAQAYLYYDYGLRLPGHGLVTTEEMIKNNPELIRSVIRATAKSVDYSVKNPEEAVKLTKQARPDLVDDKIFLSVFKESVKLYAQDISAKKPWGMMDRAVWEEAEKLVDQYLGLETKKGPDAYFTNDFVK